MQPSTAADTRKSFRVRKRAAQSIKLTWFVSVGLLSACEVTDIFSQENM